MALDLWFNWVPPTAVTAFVLISVVEEQDNTFWEQCYIKESFAENQNKILLENLLKSAWESVGK